VLASALARSAPTPSPTLLQFKTAEYLAGYCSQALPAPQLRGTPVALPVLLQAASTRNCLAGRWIRVTFELSEAAARTRGPFAVLIRHALPNCAVYINGNYLGASQGFDDASSRSWNYPQYLQLPAALLRPGTNQLLIDSTPRGSDLTELGPIVLGDAAAISVQYSHELWLQVIGVEVVSLLVGLIGLFAGLLWLRRRHETVFGLFALSCLIWIVRNAQFFVVHEYSVFYFGLLTDAALFWLAAVLYSLCFRILERPISWFERSLYVYALAATVTMYLAGPAHKADATFIGFLLLVPVGIVFQLYLTREVWRAPTVLRFLLWLAAIVSSAAGGYDLALMVNRLPWRDGFLMPYSALVYALTVGWALIDRFVRTHTQYEQLNLELEARVQQRERQLADNYQRSAQLEREHAVRAERDRILRDMHDGLGLHLIAALRLLEKPEQARQQLIAILRDAMDELRIAIDSMKPSGQDLLVMLGNLRYRLEPRLRAAGISLHWSIAPDCEPGRLGASEITEVTRIVQELCTNAIKHSQATDMHLSIEELANAAVRITVIDNGVGYDVGAAHQGEGLKSLRRRAANLSARLEMQSQPGETRVALTLSAPPAAAATEVPASPTITPSAAGTATVAAVPVAAAAAASAFPAPPASPAALSAAAPASAAPLPGVALLERGEPI
jgi:signal transduction histidine kinase